jgi:hypothetical protein
MHCCKMQGWLPGLLALYLLSTARAAFSALMSDSVHIHDMHRTQLLEQQACRRSNSAVATARPHWVA